MSNRSFTDTGKPASAPDAPDWPLAGTALALPAAAALPGCGGGTDKRRAQIRLVNASTGNQRLELRTNDVLRHADVPYGERAGYAEADPDKPETTVFSSGSLT
jgi:hypothetical protein